MRVVFATAELAPFVKVGGLGDAAAGLVAELRELGLDVEVAIPDYGGLNLRVVEETRLDVPEWAGPATASRGSLGGFEDVTLVQAPGLERSHPYVDGEGRGWPDNDVRFMSFSAAVAALVRSNPPDVLHLNDWHTGATLGLLEAPPPSVLTIHNLAYQGYADGGWLMVLRRRPEAYEWYGGMNPLTGAIALSNKVVTVSPTFAREVLLPRGGFGVHGALAARGGDFVGILNGIDTGVWDPSSDPHLPTGYDEHTVSRKRAIGRLLSSEIGWAPGPEPIIGMVTRLTEQKGVDLALEVAKTLETLGARMILLGSGERTLAEAANRLASHMSGRFAFREGYDEALAHRIFAGSDLFLMPSRFEPAGLAQMQAMRYGTIPVVTDVGGLHDTVIDADDDAELGTGFVAREVTSPSVADALARAIRAWRSTRRRGAIRRRGMGKDWSWRRPAGEYAELYRRITKAR